MVSDSVAHIRLSYVTELLMANRFRSVVGLANQSRKCQLNESASKKYNCRVIGQVKSVCLCVSGASNCQSAGGEREESGKESQVYGCGSDHYRIQLIARMVNLKTLKFLVRTTTDQRHHN